MQTRSTKRVVCQTASGSVICDAGCAVIQVEFGNLLLRFDFNGFAAFKRSIDSIDWKRSEAGNEKKPYHRKIFVALQPSGVTMAFHREEISELKTLLDNASLALATKRLCAQTATYPLN
ncbi:MAG: hypothetical protein RMM16_00145 [Chloroherpetonaceae bacterium]|nr:hypothetical protein [Chloroherpetonaceae bacterium]